MRLSLSSYHADAFDSGVLAPSFCGGVRWYPFARKIGDRGLSRFVGLSKDQLLAAGSFQPLAASSLRVNRSTVSPSNALRTDSNLIIIFFNTFQYLLRLFVPFPQQKRRPFRLASHSLSILRPPTRRRLMALAAAPTTSGI